MRHARLLDSDEIAPARPAQIAALEIPDHEGGAWLALTRTIDTVSNPTSIRTRSFSSFVPEASDSPVDGDRCRYGQPSEVAIHRPPPGKTLDRVLELNGEFIDFSRTKTE